MWHFNRRYNSLDPTAFISLSSLNIAVAIVAFYQDWTVQIILQEFEREIRLKRERGEGEQKRRRTEIER